MVLLLATTRDRSSSVTAQPAPQTSPVDGPGIPPPVLPNVSSPEPLVEGIRALAAEDFERAADLLKRASGSNRSMEDVRLLTLAEATHALEDFETARSALETLISDHARSPLRGVALLRATQIAAEHRQFDTAAEWAALGRGERLPASVASEIEVVLWEIGSEQKRVELQTLAGRSLLVRDPQLAEELEVYPTLQRALGLLDLTELLTADELRQRARALIDSREPDEALESLDLIPSEERSFEGSLLRAEALTRDRRGRDALEVLADLDSSDPERKVAITFQRALAAREASKVRRGRANLSSSQRDKLAREASILLREVADTTRDDSLRLRSLEILFAQISDEDDSFDQALAVLQELKRIDPSDTTGTRYLFRRGWRAYVQRDYTVAIGYWSELESLYSGTSTARSGRYWTGRAHETLGHAERANSIYREIVGVGAVDFYARHARSRLDEPDRDSATLPKEPTEPWPADSQLTRARWLSDLGLSELALHELEAFRETADRRAFCADKAVLLARTGERRESIGWLVCAFPYLGRTSQRIAPREALELYYPLDFREIIEQRASEQQLSPYLVFAMVRQESAFDAAARSWAGARGLMQLMPATGKEVAQRLGLRYSTGRLEDPDFSVRLGTRYFRQVLDMFDGNEELALAGYNGGPYRIKKLWRQAGSQAELDRFLEGLALEETKTYVKRILLFEDTYERLYDGGG